MKPLSSSSSFRYALPADCERLSGIALRSKAHWGYDRDFLEACRRELTITPDLLDRATVRLLEVDGRVAGFYALARAGREARAGWEGELELELTHLWLDPPHIGQGLGHRMWCEVTRTAAKLGCARILIHSDPNAEGFYDRMGAERIGEIPSASIPGRKLPLMEYRIQ